MALPSFRGNVSRRRRLLVILFCIPAGLCGIPFHVPLFRVGDADRSFSDIDR
jgi:hypothetical protein